MTNTRYLAQLCIVFTVALVSCQADRATPPNSVRIQNEFYTLSIPDAYEVRYKDAQLYLRRGAHYTIVLVPVKLLPGDTPAKMLATVEPMHLRNTPERKVVRYWRGKFPIAGSEHPALYVVQLQRRDGRQQEVINSYVPREGWLLGVTIIGENIHEARRAEIEALLRHIEFRK